MKKLLELQIDLLYLLNSDQFTRDCEEPIGNYKYVLEGRIDMLSIVLQKINKLKKQTNDKEL
jgi:hypothetical protein